MVLQYRSVAILAAVSAFATLFYLSLWSHLGQVDQDTDTPQNTLWPNVLNSKEHPTDQPPKHQQKHAAPQPEQQPQSQQQQQLVSENNARVAALNTQAFASFCNSKPAATKPEFASYRDWIDYINNKNSKWAHQKQHPLYLERPLPNWVVNLTAMNDKCNRLVHTSAHCLSYLTREHEYLIPPKVSEFQAPPPAMTPMSFHIFWRGPITDKLSLSAHSFLFTQPLKRAHLHLWIDSADLPDGLPEDYAKNAYAAPLIKEPLNRFITIHAWDQAAELAYSYGEDEDDSKHALEQQLMSLSTPEEQHKPVKPVALSDEARFLILNRNGGIYLDADVLLLKDMSPFHDSGIEFAYEWSHTRMYNTAILRLYPGSSVARRILDGAKNRQIEILRKKLLQMQATKKKAEGEDEGEDEDTATEKQQALAAAHDQEGRKKKVDIVRQPKIRTKKTLRRRSPATHPEAAQFLKRGEMRPEEIYHPARLRTYLRPQDSKIEGNGLEMMPPAFFDPLWLRVDHAETKETQDTDLLVEDLHSFPDAFTKADAVCPGQDDAIDFSAGPEVFLAGAYAYHWHNNWETAIEPRSWMGLMKQAYDDFVNAQRPNLYGEWFEEQL